MKAQLNDNTGFTTAQLYNKANRKLATFTTRATPATPATRKNKKPAYKAVCHICGTSKALTVYKRAEGDIVLCQAHDGGMV
jgi:hypothetical protein